MRVRSEYYREQAERSRRMARKVLDPDAKGHLLSVAERYDQLAKDAEANE